MVYGLWFRVSFSSRVWAWGFGFCGDFLNFEISDLKPEEICSAQNVCILITENQIKCFLRTRIQSKLSKTVKSRGNFGPITYDP